MAIASNSYAEQESISADIVGYGIIKNDTSDRIKSIGEKVDTVNGEDYHLLDERPDLSVISVHTEKIPAKIGTRFGILFKTNGSPEGETVDLNITIRLPDGIKTPASGKITLPFKGKFNKLSLFNVSLDKEEDLVPGNYTIEVWHQEKKLCEQKFEVYKP